MKRNSNSNCYWCNKSGHFKKDCPELGGSGNKKRKTSPENSPAGKFKDTHCPCGGGICEIQVSEKTGSPRYFYSCPAKNEMRCLYFKWCKELRPDQVLHSRPLPYPICSCEAGVSRLETERNGPNAGRKYFACRVKKGFGACNFRLWYDDYIQSALAANEIDMIREALENGEMELDFPYPTEEAPDERDISASDCEMFAGDSDSSSDPSPRRSLLLYDVSRNGYLSERETDDEMENFIMSPTFEAVVEDLASIVSNDKGWWF